MYAIDFEYDGIRLSEFGFMICNFGSESDVDTVSAGSEINFNRVATHYGKYNCLAGTKYDSCITATIQICKNTDKYEDLLISDDEYRWLMRWLNRREFKQFSLVDRYLDDTTCYYDASFNVSKIMWDKDLYGLELEMATNRPFGYGNEVVEIWSPTSNNLTHNFEDSSDEIGYLYPSLKITINQSGDFSLSNSLENCTMTINNCTSGEVITIDGYTHIIQSSLNAHKVYNDFNFEYFRIGNTLDDRTNIITASLPCTIELRYSPIIKNTPV